MNMLNSDLLDNNIITDFEIHYISESKEGQKLDIFKKISEDNIDFLIKNQDKEIVRARAEFKAIDN